MKRLLREPLIHFLLLGGLLMLARGWWADDIVAWVAPPKIVVTDTDRQYLRQQWLEQTGRMPSASELSALVRDFVDDELLFREAKRLDLHKHDPVTRQRLIRNMRFIDLGQENNDEALYEAAIALGMEDTDPVVRQRLIQLMRYRLESQVAVTEAEIQNYYQQHRDRFRQPAQLSFEHLYFSTERRGEQAQADASHALAQLQAGQSVVSADPFLLGNRFNTYSLDRIERQFGNDFVIRLRTAQPGEWFGPVRSSYGLHLVHIHELKPTATTDYRRARKAAAADLFTQREQAMVQATLQDLRNRYRIHIQGEAS